MKENFTILIPPGFYFIGDPAYAIDDDLWHKIGKETSWFANSPVYKGEKGNFIIFSVDGDGVYESNDGYMKFGVDSGSIGIVPESYLPANLEEKIAHEKWLRTMGIFKHFQKPTYVKRRGDILMFGSIVIPVGSVEEEADEVEDLGVEYWEVDTD